MRLSEATPATPPRRWPLALLAAGAAVGLALWLLGPGDLWVRAMAWIVATQRELHQALATALREVQASGPVAASGLVSLSFLYGVFHAAGPGHGKVVITTYLATQKESLARGIALAVTASLVQGMVAILAVFVTIGVFEQTARQSQLVAGRIETLSFLLLAGLGLFLVWRHGRRLGRPVVAASACGCGDPHHEHHVPPPDRAFVAGLLSIGLRPCSGAILVLVLAIALELRLAGILAVIAMSLGTALTVAGLASLAVLARAQAERLAHRLDHRGPGIARLADIVALTGGLLLAAMGVSLLLAQVTLPAHPLL